MGKEYSFQLIALGTTEYQHTKEWSWIPISHHIQILTQNVSKT